MFSSRATEFGRGTKIQKLSDAPDWTPGPDAYTIKSDFVNQSSIQQQNPNKDISPAAQTGGND